MTKLENLLNEKIPALPPMSFDGCTVVKKSRTAVFTFYAAAEVPRELVDKMAAVIKEEAGGRYTVTVDIKKPPKTADAVRAALTEYIKYNFLSLYPALAENGITVDRVEEKNITVYVNIKDSLKGYAESCGFAEKCSEFLAARYLTPSYVITRIERESREQAVKEYISAQNDYKKVRPRPVDNAEQQMLFGGDEPVPAYLADNTFVAFDFETTGFDGMIDKIIEIGAVKISGGTVTETFSTLINPKMPIPKDSIKIHGISDIMVKDAPSIEEVIPDFLRFAEGCPLIGHNVIDFDSKFLRAACLSSGVTADFKFMDTLTLARENIRGLSNYKLGTVAAYLKTPVSPDHRALSDAQASADVFIKIIKRRGY